MHKLAEEVARIHAAFNLGDNRKDDVRKLAKEIDAALSSADVVVRDCDSCPAGHYVQVACALSNMREVESPDDATWPDKAVPVPDWCPLRKSPVLLKLEDKE